MATPKTPRKRADKPGTDKTATPEAVKKPVPEAVVDPAAPASKPGADGYEVVPATEAATNQPGLKPDKAADTDKPGAKAESGEKPDEVTQKTPDSAGDKAADAAAPDAPKKADAPKDTAKASGADKPTSPPKTDKPPQDEKPQQDEKADASPPALLPAPAVVKSSPGFVPLVLGGVVAAGLGFALARYVVPEGWPVPGSTPLQSQLTQQADEIDALRAQLQALPKDDITQTLQDELAALRDTAATAQETAEAARDAVANIPEPVIPEAAPSEDLSPRFAALEDRIAAIEAQPGTDTAPAPTIDPAVITRLQADIDSLRQGLNAQEQELETQKQGLEAQKTAAENLVAEAEAIRAEAQTKAQTVLLQAALTKVEAAMENGATFAQPLAVLENSGLEVPAILAETAESGVPTLAALADSFDAPARIALEKGLRGNMGSTWTDRVGSYLRSQTGARSLTPKEGDDPDAVLSRANAAVAKGDLQTALTEIATLPEQAQAALSDWVEQAKLRLDAQAATAALATALSER